MKKEIVFDKEIGERTDIFLASEFPDYSRSYFSNLIKRELVLNNGKKTKSSSVLSTGDRISINFQKRNEPDLTAQKIDLEIIYEDHNVIVINKQPGLVVHPGSGNNNGTLVNALLYYFPQIKDVVYDKGNPVSESRPGLVHRLDKDTSGVMIIAKNDRSMHSLAKQIQNRTIEKVYLAICEGWPKTDSGRLVNYLGRDTKDRKKIADIGENKGKKAISDYKVLEYFTDIKNNKMSLIEFKIQTGRTHQIRVQSKIIGHPVLGDTLYFNAKSHELTGTYNIKRQLLHAHKLAVYLLDQDKPQLFISPMPDDFRAIIKDLTKH